MEVTVKQSIRNFIMAIGSIVDSRVIKNNVCKMRKTNDFSKKHKFETSS